MAEAFSVSEKIGEVCSALEEPDRKELIYALHMYGMFGEEVELSAVHKVMFDLLKKEIDYSKSMRARGAKGGRKKAANAKKNSSKALPKKDKVDGAISSENSAAEGYQTPSKALAEGYQTPSKALAEGYQTPSKALAEGYQTPSKALAEG
ncbi:DUF6291 domain-containing protein, partial [Collinsella sp. AGMB00827]